MVWFQRRLRNSSSLRIHGIPVELRNTRTDIRDADVLARLDEALDLIAHHQPVRFRHLERDIQGIRIERFPTRGAFLPEEGVILTELTFLARRDISAAPVASSILHEAIHARVRAFRSRVMGGSDERASMAREERLCRRAELEFGMSLPDGLGEPVIQRAMASLALSDDDVAPAIDWRIARARQNEVDRTVGP